MHSLRLVGRKLDALPKIPEVNSQSLFVLFTRREIDRPRLSNILVGQDEAALLTAPMESWMEAWITTYTDYFIKIIVKY